MTIVPFHLSSLLSLRFQFSSRVSLPFQPSFDLGLSSFSSTFLALSFVAFSVSIKADEWIESPRPDGLVSCLTWQPFPLIHGPPPPSPFVGDPSL